MEIFGYLASVCIGIILGLLGGGGSILSIPLLVYCFHLDVVMATAYSLFIVGVTSLAGAIPKYRENRVNLQTGVVFGIPSIVAIFATRKWIVPAIPDVIFQVGDFSLTKRLMILGLFGILMILSSVAIIRRRGEIETEDQRFQHGLVVIEGVLIGFLTGLVGAGGGFLIIPALVLLTGLPFKTAVGTSLFIIAINSLTGFLGDVLNYSMDWPFLLTITGLAVAGILVGNAWSRRARGPQLRKAFGWFTLAMGTFMVIRELTQA
ncbi:MAG: sulfite exporter TauE/SafE family protein [Cyclobacteriaceae bacterium]|jgi:uncharacterized membrane protein YfcA|nr:sulfite exporter TauE/SafE family protein [Cyclobacteriaceae bacterium]